ncbi:MAG: hypothetical protein FWF00_04175 [Endomicrobia bacterium]|nr:hypothetical protein [Endomicrobiia bacterium]MCL2506867.1 hypothetical protein [Endomicrobiia bacterium]
MSDDISKKNHKPEEPEPQEDIQNTYDVEGLIGGGAAGLIIGILISLDVVLTFICGMFIGLVVGTRIKKDKNK